VFPHANCEHCTKESGRTNDVVLERERAQIVLQGKCTHRKSPQGTKKMRLPCWD
jgi:hypothetical protein